ncbi:MAG: hypothetical protein Q8Q03_02375 [bacterium]|nr:hypothetical protein [bacterium]
MASQKFFKLFPPPKFLDVPYAGLDICDDAVRCVEYSRSSRGLSIHRYGTKFLSPGTIEGGDVKNVPALKEAISILVGKLGIHTVRASLPEEKMYLFQTEVPSTDEKEIRQNIEFKLEENVPLSPAESVFFFSLIPGTSMASVSVAPKSVVVSYLEMIKSSGVSVVSFEIQAKAIARSLVPRGTAENYMIIYIMNFKTGIYVICGGVVCFTSTIPWGHKSRYNNGSNIETNIAELRKHVEQVFGYWGEHGRGTVIRRIALAGHGAMTNGVVSRSLIEFTESISTPESKVLVEIGRVWQNADFSEKYIPLIPYDDSLDYAASAGLALPDNN